jgi:signal transduction histidine kinase
MSAPVATVPTAEIRAQGLPVGRMAIVTVVYLTIVIAAATYPLVSPLRDYVGSPVTPLEQSVHAITAVIWLVPVLVSMARQPHGRLWKLMFLAVVSQWFDVLRYVPDSLAWSVANVIWPLGLGVLVHLLVAFPTGYLRARFDRAVVLLGYAIVIGWSLVELFLTGDRTIVCLPDCVRNLFVIWSDPQLYAWLGNVFTIFVAAVLFPLVLAVLWRHWRSAGAVARRTLLPLVVAVPLMALVSAADWVSAAFKVQPATAFFDSPSGLLIALLVPSALPIGLLLGILRTRWSRGRIAELVVDLGRGVPVGGLRDVLAQTLGDPTIQLVFAAPSGGGFVDASGRPSELPVADPSRTATRLERDGELLGVLIHDPAIEAEDPGLVEAVGNAARLALENERLAAEVRAQLDEVLTSRARIVQAGDAERRRVERDLHDGAQQRLVALAMRLQLAKATAGDTSALLDEATFELQTAIGEVRGLARGIHPTILSEAGLRAAVDALAERTPVPVTVDVAERRYDPQLEAAAYFVVAEALTNVVRYAGATEARVSAGERDGRFVVTITDDGRGGADPAAGSGLRGLADRVAAVEGRLTISSPSGGGTIIRAELPLTTAGGTAGATFLEAKAASPLARVRTVPEARAVAREHAHVRLSNPAVLIAGVAGVIVAVALIGALPTMQPRPRVDGRAESFVRPFVYQVPAGSDIVLEPTSDRLHVLLLPGRRSGISIWAVDEVLVNHCWWEAGAPPGAVAPRQPGAAGLLSYIRSVDRLDVAEVGRLTIDGRPAVRVDLSVHEHDSGCLDRGSSVLLWRDTSPIGQAVAMQVPLEGRVPVTILEVDGQTIAIEIWSDDLDRWLPTAQPIVESIRFLYLPPRP